MDSVSLEGIPRQQRRAVFNANRETHDRVSRFTNGIGFFAAKSEAICLSNSRVWKLIQLFYVKIL